MLRHIIAFEWRYQVKSPVFWVGCALFFLFTFGSVTIDQIQIGGRGNVYVNAPLTMLQTLAIMSLFAIFVIVAIVVPWGSLSKASTASCFVPLAVEAEGMRSGFADLFATLLAQAILVFEGLLLCDIGGSFSGLRHSAPSPPKPRNGSIASGAGSRGRQN